MPFDRPTLAQLGERTETDIESRIPGAYARLRRSNLGVLARVFAGALNGLYGFVGWVADQILVDTAEAEILERHGGIWGIDRKAATFATGDVTVTGSAGASMTLVSPIAGVASAAVVAAGGLTGGFDEESDDALRARVLARIQQPPHGGASFDYEAWALEIASVTRAWVYAQELGAGTVTVRFVHDDRTVRLVNMVLHSADLTDADWDKGGTATAPTADTIDFAAGPGDVRTAASIAADELTSYTFRFEAQDVDAEAAVARLGVWDDTQSAWILDPAGNAYFDQIESAAWTAIEKTFTTPAGCTEILLYVAHGVAAGAESLKVHRVQLNPGDTAAAYAETAGAAIDLDAIIPGTADVEAVQAHIDAVRPVTAAVTVVAPVPVPFDVEIGSLNPSTQAVRAAIEAEIADLIRREAEPGTTILLSHLREAVSIAAGEHDHVVVSPSADVSHAAGEIAVADTITWS